MDDLSLPHLQTCMVTLVSDSFKCAYVHPKRYSCCMLLQKKKRKFMKRAFFLWFDDFKSCMQAFFLCSFVFDDFHHWGMTPGLPG